MPSIAHTEKHVDKTAHVIVKQRVRGEGARLQRSFSTEGNRLSSKWLKYYKLYLTWLYIYRAFIRYSVRV